MTRLQVAILAVATLGAALCIWILLPVSLAAPRPREYTTELVHAGAYQWFYVTEGSLPPTFFQRGVERQIAQLFVHILSTRDAPDAVVWDIGMNSGYYTGLAAVAGVVVHAWEPQPKCHEMMAWTILKNGFTNVHPHLAGAGLESRIIKQGTRICDSGYQVGQQSADDQSVDVPVERLSYYDHNVILAKIDTEGYEVFILQDLLPLFVAGRIKNIIVEVVPHIWRDAGAGVQVLEQLQRHARTTLLLEDGRAPRVGVMPTTHAHVSGSVYTITNMAHFLLKGRKPNMSGCNVWFSN